MPSRINRNSLILILSACTLYFSLHGLDSRVSDAPKDKLTLNAMPGTWSAPAGPEGNEISFVWTKLKEQPANPLNMLVSAYETSGRIKNLLEFKDTPFTFGYLSHSPDVVVFANLGEEQSVFKLKARDHNHMRLQRLSKNYDTQKEDMAAAPKEPPIDLVRKAEPAVRLPDYK
ncbi:MAG: hypothetical protein JST01_24910 [Cyanobacteria bacterium SZAS TMP-1]|nr:hypothetical protein [Cyanobacteria bacterium SZAS TMP-1]